MTQRAALLRLWIVCPLLAAVAAAGCGEDEQPQPVPEPSVQQAQPQEQPQEDPLEQEAEEQAAPERATIGFWQIEPSWTGRDFIGQLTSTEADCLEQRLGEEYAALLDSPLAGEAGDLLDVAEGGPSYMAECLTTEHLVSARLSMLAAEAGGLSELTRACILGLLDEEPQVGQALGQAEGPDEPAAWRVLACLSEKEAEALVPSAESAPDTEALACLIGELGGTAEGRRIIAVLTGDDPTGQGLTVPESAMLGEAVDACGIETDLIFPDSAEDDGQ